MKSFQHLALSLSLSISLSRALSFALSLSLTLSLLLSVSLTLPSLSLFACLLLIYPCIHVQVQKAMPPLSTRSLVKESTTALRVI